MRIVIADDEMLLREGLARLLADAGFDVVAKATNGPGAPARGPAHRTRRRDYRHQDAADTHRRRARRGARNPLVASRFGVLVLSRYLESSYVMRLWGGKPAPGSRGRAVLVNEPAESIPAMDPERIRGSGEAESGSRLGRHESQAMMRTMAVVMLDVLCRTRSSWRRPVIGIQSRHSRRTVATKRSPYAFACGAWIGVRTISIPSLRNSSSKAPLNFASRSWISKRGGEARSASDHDSWRACCATQSWLGCCTARDVHPAATKLDEEQDVGPCREDGVEGEEVAREHARGLAADELAPANARSLPSGSEPCFAQQLADRRRRDAESERAASSPAIRW